MPVESVCSCGAYTERCSQAHVTKTKRERIKEARELLDHARDQWDSASTDAWEPAEPADCVTKCFYAYENALMAAVLATGGSRTTKHWEKAKLAEQLRKRGKLKTDVSHRLTELNELRKDVSYGEPGYELQQVDLEDLVSELERFLDEVEGVVKAAEDEL